MKTHHLKLLTIIALFGFITSCKKEGCTDRSSPNYDPDAEVSDGSCVPYGRVIFWVYNPDANVSKHYYRIDFNNDNDLRDYFDEAPWAWPENCDKKDEWYDGNGIPVKVVSAPPGFYEYKIYNSVSSALLLKDTLEICEGCCTIIEVSQ